MLITLSAVTKCISFININKYKQISSRHQKKCLKKNKIKEKTYIPCYAIYRTLHVNIIKIMSTACNTVKPKIDIQNKKKEKNLTK